MAKEFVGKGALGHIKDVLTETGAQKIFLVTGKQSYETSGAREVLERALDGRKVVRFCEFPANPGISDVERGIEQFRNGAFDLVIGVGGGSALDVAKAVNVLAANEKKVEDYLFKRAVLQHKSAKLVAIPTTAGSGSEVTRYAALYVGSTKHSFDNELFIPDYAIVDPVLTYTVPPRIAASCGMDALAQAIESYWNVRATPASQKIAAEAIVLAWRNLRAAVHGSDKNARDAISRASYLAGKAIDMTRTTACHAVSYPITMLFGVPHGHAVALTLGKMFEYNSETTNNDISDKRGAEYVARTMQELSKLLGAKSAADTRASIDALMDDIGLERRLSLLGFSGNADIERVIENGFNPDRVRNNPRFLTKEGLRDILASIF